MKTARFFGVGMLAVILALSFIGEGWSAEGKFPTRPIQVIIGFAPGDTDNALRPFVETMPEYLGQPMSFVYKPGAAGAVGAAFVAAAKPDGYILVGTSQSSIAVVPLTQKDCSYTWESFAPVAFFSDVPYLFAVNSSSPWKTIKEFVAAAKKEPDKLSYSSSGTFGLPHICGEMFAKAAGIKLNYIPSQGTTPAVTAVLGGHVSAVSSPSTPSMPHIKAGTLRALAVFGKERSKYLPDVPTFLEMGYPVSLEVVTGFLAPKGTPQEVIDAFNIAGKKAIQNHEAFIVDRLDKIGVTLHYGGPAEYTALLKYNHELFSKVLKDLLK